MRFAICNEIYQGWSLEDTCRHAAATGYDGIEIAPFTLAKLITDLSPARRSEIKDIAARSGLAISAIHWVLVQTEGLHVTHPDSKVRQRTAQYFVDLVDFGADIGATHMVVGSPKQRNLSEGVTVEQGLDFAREVFRHAVHQAEQRGLTICFEPLAPAETNFINTAADAIAFAQSLRSPAMKVILDVKAMCAEAKPIPQLIRESAPHFAYFHANDRNLKGPGFGDVDFGPIAAALKEVGYEGWVSVEVFRFEEGPDAIATQSLRCLRTAFNR